MYSHHDAFVVLQFLTESHEELWYVGSNVSAICSCIFRGQPYLFDSFLRYSSHSVDNCL